MFKMLIKMLIPASGGGRMLCETAMLLLGTTTTVAIGTLLFTGSVSADKICSRSKAAETALQWVGEKDARVISVSYEHDSGGYWVRILDNSGRIRDFFVEEKC